MAQRETDDGLLHTAPPFDYGTARDTAAVTETGAPTPGLPLISDGTRDALSSVFESDGGTRFRLRRGMAILKSLEAAYDSNQDLRNFLAEDFSEDFGEGGDDADWDNGGIRDGAGIVLEAYRRELGTEEFASLISRLETESFKMFRTTLANANTLDGERIKAEIEKEHSITVGTKTRIAPETPIAFKIKTGDANLDDVINKAKASGINRLATPTVAGAAAMYEALSIAAAKKPSHSKASN